MFIRHLDVIISEVPIKDFCSVLYWIVFFFLICRSPLTILDMNSFLYVKCQVSFSFCHFSILSLFMVSFHPLKSLILMKRFSFTFSDFCGLYRELSLSPKSWRYCPILSSQSLFYISPFDTKHIWIWFLCMMWGKGQVSSFFIHRCPIFPAPFTVETFLHCSVVSHLS